MKYPTIVRVLVSTPLLVGVIAQAQPTEVGPVRWPVNGHSYEAIAVSQSISWTEANAAAIRSGGYLATLASAEENAFVFSLIDSPAFWRKRGGGDAFGPWIGGIQNHASSTFSEPAGGWEWVDGRPFAYANWAPGEPNEWAGAHEDFAFFYSPSSEPAATWADESVEGNSNVYGYVVEFDCHPVDWVQGPDDLLAEFDLDGNDPPSLLQAAQPRLTRDRYGNPLQAMQFPDSGFVGSTTLDFFKNRQQWSWTGWVKPSNAAGGWQDVFSEGVSGGTALSISIRTSQVVVGIWNEDLAPVYWTHRDTPQVVQSGEWQHLAVTFNGTSSVNGICNVFVNGTNVLSTVMPMLKASGPGVNDHTFCLGDNIGAYTSAQEHLPFEGHLDEVLIFSRTLSACEVKQLVDAPDRVPQIVTPPEDQNIAVGDTATFHVIATGLGALSYEWQFEGAALAGQTNATLTLQKTTHQQAGMYRVIIRSTTGFEAAASARLLFNFLTLKTYAGLTIDGPVGSVYRVEYVDAVGDQNNWQTLTTLTLTTSPFVWIDMDSPNAPRRFYRAVPAQ